MRAAIFAAAFVLTATTVMAQITDPQTFTVMPKSQHNAGTFTSASATIPDGAGSVFIADLLSDADALDVANTYDVVMEASLDGVQWFGFSRTHWIGGTHFDKRTGTFVPNHMEMGFTIYQPGENNGVGLFVGMRVRVTLDNPNRLNLGFTVMVNPR